MICSYMRVSLRQQTDMVFMPRARGNPSAAPAANHVNDTIIMFLDRPQKPATERDTKNNMEKTEGTGKYYFLLNRVDLKILLDYKKRPWPL